MKRIGIITYHRVRDYGSVLQAYALLRYLKNQGHDVSIINYIPRAHSTKMEFLGTPEGPVLKRMIYVIGSFPIRLKVHSVYKDFRSNYLKLTEHEYRDKADLTTYPLDLDVYVTGGDQVWNSQYDFHG